MKKSTKELLYKSAYREIFYHVDKKMLEMCYLSGSTDCTDEEYKEEEFILVQFFTQKEVDLCCVNNVNLDYIIMPYMQEWVKETVNPVLIKEGVKKLAVITSQQVFSRVSVRQMTDKFSKDASSTCPIRHFTDQEVALAWLFE
jgi:hypothetical protein